ncbi:MAG: hypothetical protein WA918_05455 [Erythrobacter sp.]
MFSENDYESVRTIGTPVGEGRSINRSIYGWGTICVQDMDDRWHALAPASGTVNYYKQEAPDNPRWADRPDVTMSGITRGLRMLAGLRHYPRDRWRGSGSDTFAPIQYSILEGSVGNPSHVREAPRTWRMAELVEHFTEGRFIKMDVEFPRYAREFADSPDHVSHVGYKNDGDFHLMLPAASYHPKFAHPGFPIKAIATSAEIDARGQLIAEPGSESHAYFIDGWQDEFREKMMDVTFANNLDMNNGDFGDGTQLLWRDEASWHDPAPVPLDSFRP